VPPATPPQPPGYTRDLITIIDKDQNGKRFFRRYHGFHATRVGQDGGGKAILQIDQGAMGARVLFLYDIPNHTLFYTGSLADPQTIRDPSIRTEGAVYIELNEAARLSLLLPKLPPRARN
jgi:hypothetical protein